MKQDKLCPKCQSKEIYLLPEVTDRAHGSAPTAMILGLNKNFWWGKVKGQVEAYICAQCGYIEYYLKSPVELKTSDYAKKV